MTSFAMKYKYYDIFCYEVQKRDVLHFLYLSLLQT